MAKLLFLFAVAVIASETSDNIKICKKYSSECLTAAIQEKYLSLGKGSQSLKIRPLEPLDIGNVVIAAYTSIFLETRNARLHGLTKNPIVSNARLNPDKLILEYDIFVPQVIADSDLKLNAKFFLVSLKGQGRFKLILTHTLSHVKIQFEKFQNNGQTYLKVVKYSIDMNETEVKAHVETFTSEDRNIDSEIMRDIINQLLNDTLDETYKELKAPYIKVLSKMGEEITNKIFKSIPVNVIFPYL